MPPLTEAQVREIIKNELQELLASDRYIFHKTIQILDGRNIQLGRSNGTKIGLSASEKLAFYGDTPIIQQQFPNAPSTPSGVYVQAEAQSTVNSVNALITILRNIGITN